METPNRNLDTISSTPSSTTKEGVLVRKEDSGSTISSGTEVGKVLSDESNTAEPSTSIEKPEFIDTSNSSLNTISSSPSISSSTTEEGGSASEEDNDSTIPSKTDSVLTIENNKDQSVQEVESMKLIPIYCLYNDTNGEHLYTVDANEKDVLYHQHDWGYEGVAWYAPASGRAVYRLYNPSLRNHLYTMDTNEVRVLTRYHGWQSDNNGRPVFYSGGAVPIYRLYNDGLRGLHHWTTDKNEYVVLPRHGWKQEGTTFYASQIGEPIQTQYASKLIYNGQFYSVRGKYGRMIIVNKKHPLRSDYHPGEDATAGVQVRKLIGDMQKLGFPISSSYSGFRSYSDQTQLYQNFVRANGQAVADRFAARPGYSEHQTGLAFDILNSQGGSLTDASVRWMHANLHRYGFILRYKQGKEHVTGYQYESWHIRYVGKEAEDIYRSGLTLEEYFGIPGGGY
ncbi:D-alanyl-D-alanine carboxypeptidase family protein [Streptococcus cuniculi]|uniref:D-alanyl-D-alanine carboxypeptidase family protein n=2 Tax=Streptococcus cuniculi TaxID=1432788 RepID=A0A4Y9JG37_9STRE|nr:D-alanyl-D-alanine carboxypeptidase family protein [Streptococcus cuniculi]TFU98979.1 D-alanyl-D-alanine carboxypeptidase family protein [Streptococcus cuniculi]